MEQHLKKTERFYLNCPYGEKDECKGLGAYWDADRRKWYVPEGLDTKPFEKWWPGESSEYHEQTGGDDDRDNDRDNDRFYLSVDFDEKDRAKALGARWDQEARRWFVPSQSNREDFKEWWPLD